MGMPGAAVLGKVGGAVKAGFGGGKSGPKQNNQISVNGPEGGPQRSVEAGVGVAPVAQPEQGKNLDSPLASETMEGLAGESPQGALQALANQPRFSSDLPPLTDKQIAEEAMAGTPLPKPEGFDQVANRLNALADAPSAVPDTRPLSHLQEFQAPTGQQRSEYIQQLQQEGVTAENIPGQLARPVDVAAPVAESSAVDLRGSVTADRGPTLPDSPSVQSALPASGESSFHKMPGEGEFKGWDFGEGPVAPIMGTEQPSTEPVGEVSQPKTSANEGSWDWQPADAQVQKGILGSLDQRKQQLVQEQQQQNLAEREARRLRTAPSPTTENVLATVDAAAERVRERQEGLVAGAASAGKKVDSFNAARESEGDQAVSADSGRVAAADGGKGYEGYQKRRAEIAGAGVLEGANNELSTHAERSAADREQQRILSEIANRGYTREQVNDPLFQEAYGQLQQESLDRVEQGGGALKIGRHEIDKRVRSLQEAKQQEQTQTREQKIAVHDALLKENPELGQFLVKPEGFEAVVAQRAAEAQTQARTAEEQAAQDKKWDTFADQAYSFLESGRITPQMTEDPAAAQAAWDRRREREAVARKDKRNDRDRDRRAAKRAAGQESAAGGQQAATTTESSEQNYRDENGLYKVPDTDSQSSVYQTFLAEEAQKNPDLSGRELQEAAHKRFLETRANQPEGGSPASEATAAVAAAEATIAEGRQNGRAETPVANEQVQALTQLIEQQGKALERQAKIMEEMEKRISAQNEAMKQMAEEMKKKDPKNPFWETILNLLAAGYITAEVAGNLNEKTGALK